MKRDSSVDSSTSSSSSSSLNLQKSNHNDLNNQNNHNIPTRATKSTNCQFGSHNDNVQQQKVHTGFSSSSSISTSTTTSKHGLLLNNRTSIHDNGVIDHHFICLTKTSKTKKFNCDNKIIHNNNRDTTTTTINENTALFNNTSHLHQQQQKLEENICGCSRLDDDNDDENIDESSLPSSIKIKTDSSVVSVDSDRYHHNTNKVELISLLNSQQSKHIPKYKLRIDTVAEFQGYRNNDWTVIETPLIDLEQPLVDLLQKPVFLRETFKLFIQSGERLTQMTKVYNDVEALTKLLEEKERDVELAARIGQSLLDQNQNQSERIDELEQELSRAKDKITQLRHEVSSKSELLRFYITKDDEEGGDDNDGDSGDDLNYASISSQHSISQKDVSQILEDLEQRVNTLEEENNRLKIEKETKALDLEDEERKELQLVNECARRLNQTNKQIGSLQEEIMKKHDENQRLGKEVHNMKQQVQQLEKQIRRLTMEREELVEALNLAHECQTELTIELIDVKDKHQNLLGAFHEKQEECRQLREQQLMADPMIFSYVDSLAYELENSFHHSFDEDNISNNVLDGLKHHHQNQTGDCFTPDSLLSSDSFYTSSPYSSMTGVTSSIALQQPCSMSINSIQSSSLQQLPSMTTSISTSPSSLQKSGTTSATTMIPKSVNHHHHPRNFFLTDKLRYIKPLEGSQILNHWRRLANPNLNDLFQQQDRYVSRIKANLQATTEINQRFITATDSSNLLPERFKNRREEIGSTNHQTSTSFISNTNSTSYLNNFVTTNSVFTFTTTSLSHTKETITEVTTTFSDVQPSTGKNEFSIDKHLLQHQGSSMSAQSSSSSLSSSNLITQTSLAQLHNRISLVEQVKNIMKVDRISSENSTSSLFSNTVIPLSQKSENKPTITETIMTKRRESISDIDIDSIHKDRITGLNELAKLFSLDQSQVITQNRRKRLFLNNRGSGGSRVITKIQMANSYPETLGALMKQTKKINVHPKTSTSDDQSNSRTNLSVLRNLRKGGLI